MFIVSYYYLGVGDSFHSKKLISCKTYLVSGTLDSPTDIVSTSLNIGGKVIKAFKNQRIFNGCFFYLKGEFSRSSLKIEQLTSLITCSGGKIVAQESLELDNNNENFRFYVLYDNKCLTKPPNISKAIYITSTWLINCISNLCIE
ncbi:hypothetical protein MXB_5669 [Myxobolus squamalis]|nr:hypothetical protein MXB_5669 [Myxobolus squamalis]